MYSRPLKADRNIRIAIEIIHDINSVGIGGSHTVNHDTEEVAALHVHVAVQEHQREEVVGRGTHVAVEDDPAVFLLVIGFDVDPLTCVINRVLVVLPGECQGRGKAVLREHPGRVEIVLAVLRVVPPSHETVVLTGVLHHRRDTLLVETVLGVQIRDHESLLGLSQGVEIDCESVGIHLSHRPDGIVEFLVGEFHLLRR